MDDCVFCNIIARKLSAEILYENDDAISILDIQPIHFGHALVIPKRHCKDFLALSPSAFHGVMDAVHVVSQALSNSLKLDGFNIFSNNGKIAGQSVFHFHFHITPRYQNDNIKFVLELKKYSGDEMAEYAEKIRKQINATPT